MKSRIGRIPQVIAIDVGSDDEMEEFSTPTNSNTMQETESEGGGEPSNTDRSISPPASSCASNSDDNALFDSDNDNRAEETDQDQEMEEWSVEEHGLPAVYHKQRKNVYHNKISKHVEELMASCLSLLNATTSSSGTRSKGKGKYQYDDDQDGYIDSWAIKHGHGYYMGNKFYCHFNQGTSCKASFSNSRLLSQHLQNAHNASREIQDNSGTEFTRDKKLAHWLISSNLSIKIVLNGEFNTFMQAACNGPDAAVPEERLKMLMLAEHDKVFAKLSHRLKNIEHISLVISQWKDTNQKTILLLSIFFIDENWNKKTFVISADPLKADEAGTSVYLKIALVLKDLGILEKIYSITCYEANHIQKASLFAYIKKIIGCDSMHLSQDRIYSTLLDQMILELRVELLSSLRYDCEPLKKIINNIDNCKCNMVFKEVRPYSVRLMEAYLDNKRKHHIDCAMKSDVISDADEECMAQIIQLDNALAYICEWLYTVAEKDFTIANKAYVICCELGNSIKKLAELRSSRRTSQKTTTAKSYEVSEAVKRATYLKKPLEAMYRILNDYRYKLEQGRAHVEAFVFDSYAYNDSYFGASKSLSLSKQQKNLTIIIEDILHQNDKRYRDVDIVDLLGFNNEERHQYEDPDAATSSSSNIISGKRRRCNQSVVIPEPEANQPIIDQIQLFRQKQIEYFKKHPDPTVVSTDLSQSRITSILSDHTMCGQFNFWKQGNQEQFPLLVKHTKKLFAIPTTTQECVKSFDPFKKMYVQISENERNDNSDFICKRALLSIWSNDFDLFKD